MTASLPQVSLEHHDRLMRHLDAMTVVGDMVGVAPAAELEPRVDDVAAFLNGLLLPHMEAAEHTLYPELERMLQNRHSMTPMRREHDEIRALAGEWLASGAGSVRLRAHRRHHRAASGHLPALRDAQGAPRRGAAVPRDHRARRRPPKRAEQLAAAMEHSGITSF